MNDIKHLLKEIEKIIEMERIKLYRLGDTNSLDSKELLRQSKKLDTLLNIYDKLSTLYLDQD